MKVFNTETINYNDFKYEITQGSGVIVIKDVYSKEQIYSARELINNFAENQETKETHFNAEAEASGKITCSREFGTYLQIKFSVN